MLHRIAPTDIIKHQFYPYDARFGERRFNFWHFIGFFVAPGALALTIGHFTGSMSQAVVATFLTVFSIVAAVMTAMFQVLKSVVDTIQIEPNRKFDPGEIAIVNQIEARIQVLRELYTSISYAVLLQVSALAPLVVLLFPLPDWLAEVLTQIVYLVAATTAIVVLSIICGLYQAVDDHADRLQKQLDRAAVNIPHRHGRSGRDEPAGELARAQ